MQKNSTILDNEANRTLAIGALKTLKWLALLSLDLPLVVIAAGFEAWVEDKEREAKEKANPSAVPFGYERGDEISLRGIP